MRFGLMLAAAMVACVGVAQAEVVRKPARGGEVILPDALDVRLHDQFTFSAVRRHGDVLYISGVIAARRQDEGRDVDSFKNAVRRAFNRLKASLEASDATFDDVTLMNTFHVWNSPDFEGDKNAQFRAFIEVKNEFMKPPHTAWTAVGTTELLGSGGIVEIQLIAHLPPNGR